MVRNKIGMVAFVGATVVVVGILALAQVSDFIGDGCCDQYGKLCEEARPSLYNGGNVASDDLGMLKESFSKATPHMRKLMFAELKKYCDDGMFAENGSLVALKSFAAGGLSDHPEIRKEVLSGWDKYVSSDAQKKTLAVFLNKKKESQDAAVDLRKALGALK